MKNGTFLIEEDEEFNYFLKSKDRRACEDAYKAQGRTAQQARIQCRADMGGSVFTKGAKKVYLTVPRGSFLLLVRLNYRGIASRLYRGLAGGGLNKSKIENTWKRMAGKQENLEKAINIGKNKKPLLCGQSCKAKIDAQYKFDGGGADFSEDELIAIQHLKDAEFLNLTGAEVAGIVGSAGGVLKAMISGVSGVKMSNAELEADRISAENERAMLEAQKKAEEERSQRVKKYVVGGVVIATILVVGGVLIFGKKKKK